MKRFLPLALLAVAAASSLYAAVPAPSTPAPLYTGAANGGTEGYKLIGTNTVVLLSEIASITTVPCIVRLQTRGLIHEGETTTASASLQASPQCIATDSPVIYRVNTLPWDRRVIADATNGPATLSVGVKPLE
jgi:opacity protein-like surface antigen